MKGSGLLVLIAAAVAVACESGSPPTGHASLSTASAAQSQWLQGSKAVDGHVLQTLVPSGFALTHCGAQGDVFLVMGWPLGLRPHDISEERFYIRNPSDGAKYELKMLLADFAWNVTPPTDARFTGYHNSTFELWLAPSDQDVVAYIKTRGHFERWPRSKYSVLCQ